MTENGRHDAAPTSNTTAAAGGLTRRGVLAAATGAATVAAGGTVLHTGAAQAATAQPAAAAAGQAAAAAAPWRHAVTTPRGADIAVGGDRAREGRFGVLFKKAPRYRPPDALLKSLASTMGEPAGINTDLDNPVVMAGYTFLGQFIDHDMTLDRSPMQEQQQDPKALTNFRAPIFNLDSVYGRGPKVDPQLYEPDGSGRLRVVRNVYGVEDLPRTANGVAQIGDARNDENLIVAQLHLLFLKFHNRCLSTGLARDLAEAQRLTRWHFQWVIVHDFLRQLVGADVVTRFIGSNAKPAMRREFYKPKNKAAPMMPIEYSVAAYRFGHSMVRAAYVLNAREGKPTVVPIFSDRTADLRGSQPLPANFQIDWWRFYPMPAVPTTGGNKARRIDAKLAGPLFELPSTVVSDAMRSLAERNLIRGERLGLPSGQEVAKIMGHPPLSNAVLQLPDRNNPGWAGAAPLWFYILREAEIERRGERLGTVGGRIVAEVILGILDADKNSYFHAKAFQPTRPIAPATGRFYMGDFVAFAQGS